jgi:hypothetical protein
MIEWSLAQLELRPKSSCSTKVYGLHQDSLGPRAWDCPMAKVGARAMGGLPKHKVCLGSSLEIQPREAC